MSESTMITRASRLKPGGSGGQRGEGRLKWLRPVASLRITSLGLLLLGAGGVVASRQSDAGQWLIIVSLLLLAINLSAALLSSPLFRVRPALFGMHVGLLLLALALAYGQLSRFRGHFEITEGQEFDPRQVIVDRQAVLPTALPLEAAFAQGAIKIDYAPGMMRRQTRSRVVLANNREWTASEGQPLIIDDYRFYVTHNKGFSALISWWPVQGGSPTHLGSLHFPSYPRLAPMQTLSWMAPDGTALTFEIRPTNIPQDDDWTLSGTMAEALLLVTLNGLTTRLQPGEAMRLPGGMFRFEGVKMWIGYRIFYDPSLYWCFASALIVICCLAVHLAGRYLRKPKTNITLADTGKVTI
ncbi:MAG: cytochrome c biogenesis protein ResB [Candidatus Thiodiazotropha sp.]